MQAAPPSGPTLLGFDVIWIATMLSAVATFAVMLAIYAATTVKDPMARRVKSLNERRKSVVASSSRFGKNATRKADAAIVTAFQVRMKSSPTGASAVYPASAAARSAGQRQRHTSSAG